VASPLNVLGCGFRLQAAELMITNECIRTSHSDHEVQAQTEALVALSYNRGVSLVQQGKNELAQEFLKASLAIQRASRVYQSHKGDIEKALYRVQEAIAESVQPAEVEDYSILTP
jgi:hypothetical protein